VWIPVEPLEFVLNQRTGLITDAAPKALAAAMDYFGRNWNQAKAWVWRGRMHYESFGISWKNVINKLLA